MVLRREFLNSVAAAALAANIQCPGQSSPLIEASGQLLFVSRGKTGVADVKTLRVKYLELDAPGQATWQVAAVFPDRKRLVVLSMEPRRDGPGKPFDEYYTQTPTHRATAS